MTDLVFNIAKGRAAHYGSLPAANDGLVAVPLEASGLEADAVLQDYDNLSVLLAGTSNEQATMGRKALASVTVAVDDTGNAVTVDAADVTWTAATGNSVGALVICYDPDTTSGTDADLIPLVKLDMAVTPAGGDVTYQFNSAGFYRAS